MDAMVTAKVEIPFSLGSTLTEEQARQIVEMGEEASMWALLQLAKMLGEKELAPDAASTPFQYVFIIVVLSRGRATFQTEPPGLSSAQAGFPLCSTTNLSQDSLALAWRLTL